MNKIARMFFIAFFGLMFVLCTAVAVISGIDYAKYSAIESIAAYGNEAEGEVTEVVVSIETEGFDRGRWKTEVKFTYAWDEKNYSGNYSYYSSDVQNTAKYAKGDKISIYTDGAGKSVAAEEYIEGESSRMLVGLIVSIVAGVASVGADIFVILKKSGNNGNMNKGDKYGRF